MKTFIAIEVSCINFNINNKQLMKKLLILILLFSFQVNAEWIEVSEKHKHLGNFSVNESCNIALEKAKKKLLEKL